jgi:hypothetical protein
MPPPCPSITAIDFFFFSILNKTKKPHPCLKQAGVPSFQKGLTFVANFFINGKGGICQIFSVYPEEHVCVP